MPRFIRKRHSPKNGIFLPSMELMYSVPLRSLEVDTIVYHWDRMGYFSYMTGGMPYMWFSRARLYLASGSLA